MIQDSQVRTPAFWSELARVQRTQAVLMENVGVALERNNFIELEQCVTELLSFAQENKEALSGFETAFTGLLEQIARDAEAA